MVQMYNINITQTDSLQYLLMPMETVNNTVIDKNGQGKKYYRQKWEYFGTKYL